MKRQISILLLCCYGLVLSKPLFPIVSDFIAHTFFESNHIATVHYENGAYHMHIEVRDASEESQNATAPAEKKQNEETQTHVLFANELPYSPDLLPKNSATNFLRTVTNVGYALVPSPPPWEENIC